MSLSLHGTAGKLHTEFVTLSRAPSHLRRCVTRSPRVTPPRQAGAAHADSQGEVCQSIPPQALVQFHGNRYVIERSGQIGLCLSYVIDPINPKMRAMTWNFCDSSARYATLLTCSIIRPTLQRIMAAVSFTNVLTVQSISPRQKIPSWKV